MVGGIVTETNRDNDHIEIVVQDGGEKLAIKVEVSEKARCVSEGDSIWWQGRKAYWTPRCSKKNPDIVLRRIGYSYAPKSTSNVF